MEEEKRKAEEEAKAPPKPSKWAWLTGNSNKLAFWKMFGGNDGLSAQIRDLLCLFKIPSSCLNFTFLVMDFIRFSLKRNHLN